MLTRRKVKYLISFNTVSFYSNISHDLGLEVIKYFISTYRENLHPKFKEKFVIDILEFILKKIYI